jgi:Ricin-type beta-trefoil lectin domain-like
MGKLAAIIATAAAVTTLTAIPAQAEPVVVYQLAGTTRCLADTGSDIVLRSCNELATDQQWIVPVSATDVSHNRATRNCLAATSTGNVLGQACGGAGQGWRRTPVTDSSFQFRNIATGKCLTAQVTVAACTTSSAKWNRLR